MSSRSRFHPRMNTARENLCGDQGTSDSVQTASRKCDEQNSSFLATVVRIFALFRQPRLFDLHYAARVFSRQEGQSALKRVRTYSSAWQAPIDVMTFRCFIPGAVLEGF